MKEKVNFTNSVPSGARVARSGAKVEKNSRKQPFLHFFEWRKNYQMKEKVKVFQYIFICLMPVNFLSGARVAQSGAVEWRTSGAEWRRNLKKWQMRAINQPFLCFLSGAKFMQKITPAPVGDIYIYIYYIYIYISPGGQG